MSDVINLRQKRKAKTRAEKEKAAVENRLIHGQTKAQKRKKEREAERAERLLDGHKRETREE